VNALNRFVVVGLLVLIGVLPAAARKKATSKTNAPKTAEVEAATRLQVFLDRANFSPGKIDGSAFGSTFDKALEVAIGQKGFGSLSGATFKTTLDASDRCVWDIALHAGQTNIIRVLRGGARFDGFCWVPTARRHP